MGDNIAWLSSISAKDHKLVGNKGANLGELYNAKFPIPNAFCITTKAFNQFLEESKIKDQIYEILKKIDLEKVESIKEHSDEIEKIITSAELQKNLEKEILEAYDHLNVDLQDLDKSPEALAILKSAREPIFVSVRGSIPSPDTDENSFAGIQGSFPNVKGNREIIEKIKQCFASVFSEKAIYYMKTKGIEEFPETGVIIQKMINADKAGTVFSKNPLKNSEEILIESGYGNGYGILSGKIEPDSYTLNKNLEITDKKISDKKIAIIRTAAGQTKTKELEEEISKRSSLQTFEIKQIADFAIKIEEHFQKPQEIEFSIEDENVYLLQTRPITTIEENPKEEIEFDGQTITHGTSASKGIASGTIRFFKSSEDLAKVKKGDVLISEIQNPQLILTLNKVVAIISPKGGVSSKNTIISREMKIPTIVGVENAFETLNEGDEVTVDGYSGKIFKGKAENKSEEVLPIEETNIEIKVQIDLPKFAERAAKSNASGIGLIKIEGIIANSGKHPLEYEAEDKIKDYKKILSNGLGKISEMFIGKPIWIRTLNLRSDEYQNLQGAPEEPEKNPLLGNQGIRFSLKHPKIFKAEIEAIKEISDKGHDVGILLPKITSVEEIQKTKQILKECEAENLKLGILIETPATTVLIKDICEEGIDLVSIGTTSLTQYTLATDKGNENTTEIYDELNWAILKQISRVIRECKKHEIETSIYGPSILEDKMVEFLVKHRIDSVTVKASDAKEVSQKIRELETEKDESEPKVDDMKDIKEEISEIRNLEQERLLKLKEGQMTQIIDQTPNEEEGNQMSIDGNQEEENKNNEENSEEKKPENIFEN